MKKFIYSFFTICTVLVQSPSAQVLLDADGPNGMDTYSLITSVLAPNHNPIEVPDCGHTEFGNHIDEIFDADLNTNVFRFHIHVNEDDDRCINFDRQRNEIKAYDKSPDNLLGIEGEMVEYKWKFKLDSSFQSSPNFTHIHQLKAVGGSESSMPLITLTTRKDTPDKLQLRYAETTSQVTLEETDLILFKGIWVEVVETVTYGENGSYEVEINQVSNGANLFSYTNGDIRMWKTDAEFIRPKWGIYRSLNNEQDLRDEDVLFANFSIEELSVSSTELTTNTSEKEIQFFPNPAVKGVLTFMDITEDVFVEIYTTNGQKVKEGFTEQFQFDISSLSTGTFLVHIHHDEGIIKKLVNL